MTRKGPKGPPKFKSKDDRNKPDLVRLNKFIAQAGICSRRDADLLIQKGEIKVNAKVVKELGTKIKPGDKVSYKGKSIRPQRYVYVLLNKPKDFITTTDDPENRKTVMQLVAKATRERIYPVGRLDRKTTGLLLFTNDGELAEKLAHPSHKIKKVYEVQLTKGLTENDLTQLSQGITLEDGIALIDELAIISKDKKTIGVEIHVGRNRIVRRLFEHLGYEVEKLDRVTYAGLTKKDLPRGKWRHLTQKEVIHLKYFLK